MGCISRFAYEYSEQRLADWQRKSLAKGRAMGLQTDRWKYGQLLGGAALAKAIWSDRPELGPWLACRALSHHIAPQRRGLASGLLRSFAPRAKARDHERLYLHTA